MFGFNNNNNPPPSSPPDPSILRLRPEECQTMALTKTRTLGFATYGSTNPSDPVIFMFHGLPGCRLVGRGWDRLCQKIGARLITIDRPGCGLSTLTDRRLTEWPADVVSLADHLGVRQFSVLGASGGGPFALACARFIPKERLRGTTVVCPIGPLDALIDTHLGSWHLMGTTAWVLRLALRYFMLPSIVRPYRTKDPARLKRVLEDQCTTPEEKAFADSKSESGVYASLDDSVAMLLQAFTQGPGGCTLDGTVLFSDWGFDLKDVERDAKVWMVHGDQDAVAPVKVAEWMDKQLGGGRLRVLQGKTHSTIWKDHSEEIFWQSAEA
ncbi:Alpha/Beta hydrolase protein [Massariosphaeria phaeospora]|uniref:Alpha/Beta hydrolase protein n=1 Tax=Massariosphaeria phaeospora TaxID=100035 RepID=A0A7C8I103_9PLEO|nr:Alpha/Beta hydrolase protein [Massariosphaeria phaeospora]